jgi:hypothetical protein
LTFHGDIHYFGEPQQTTAFTFKIEFPLFYSGCNSIAKRTSLTRTPPVSELNSSQSQSFALILPSKAKATLFTGSLFLSKISG